MADKKLSIIVEGKIAPSVQQFSRIVDDLASKSNKAAKAWQSMTGLGGAAGAAGAKGGAAAALLKEKKLLDSLGTSGEKFAKVLNDQVSRAHKTLSKELETATAKLDLLMKKQEQAVQRGERLRQQGRTGALAINDAIQSQLGAAATAQGFQIKSIQDALGGGAGAGAGGGGALGALGALGGGAGAYNLISMVASRLGIPMGMVNALGPLAGLYYGGKAGYNLTMGAMEYPRAAGASLGRAEYATATQNLDSLYGYGQMAHGYGREGMGIRRGLGDFLIDAKAFGKSLIFQSDAERILMSADKEKRAAAKMQGREVAEEIGDEAALPQDLLKRQIDAGIVRFRMRHGKNAWENVLRASAATDNLFGAPEMASWASGLSPFVGARSGVGYTGAIARAVAGGMDPGVAMSIIGKSAVGGVNPLSYMGGLDPTIKGLLGDYVGGTMGATGQMWQGAGGALADAMSGAMTMGGGPGGVRQAQQVALGMGAYGGAFGGHDAFQKSYNIAAASAALGTGASPYTRAFLADQMRDPKVLASIAAGNLPPAFEAMGITLDQAQRAMRDIDRGLVSSRWYDTGDDSAAARRMRDIKAAGGPMQWAQSLKSLPAAERRKAIEEAAPMLAYVQSGLTGTDVGTAEGMLFAGAGLAIPASARAKMRKGGAAADEEDDPLIRETKLRNAIESNTLAVEKNTDALHYVVDERSVGGRSRMDEDTRAMRRFFDEQERRRRAGPKK